jgi:glycerophosphoryl diester phosphodiesterase
MKVYSKYSLFSLLVLSGLLFVQSCDFQRKWQLDVPGFPDDSFLSGTHEMTDACGYALEGIYRVTAGSDLFGDTVVLKHTGDRIALFGYKNISYFIFKPGTNDPEIRLEGCWRFAQGDETGLARLSVFDASAVIAGDTTLNSIRIEGSYGIGTGFPSGELKMELISRFTYRLRKDPFIIGAHRGGGRTSDRLPVSENSVAMINYTRYFGSTGIEVDVQLTRDKVPVLYHDDELNVRLIRKGPVLGRINDYNYSQLLTMVRLIHGEPIPSLEEALGAAYSIPEIRVVWLDIKDPAALEKVIPIQKEFLDKAEKEGRDLQILIGIPSAEVYDAFIKIAGYQDRPSLCELSPAEVTSLNSRAWGFRWTQGLMEQEVSIMHSQGRLCFVWTLDVPQFTELYTAQGGNNPVKRFDGILTNYPTILAYYHYVRHNY